ncbi:Imm61 family immunity protein [Mycolicibacterium neoaurum]|uniref:Imm61 family immunity protein n=1 Tax=Mycolicibacterium neoaurum TaxID=1795 RepID=UPI001F4D0228|nr:Imm61 family immunity protein [Mycolicibacterium neoaurum]
MGRDREATPHPRVPVALTAECVGWARTAHYVTTVAEDGDVQLRSEAGAPTRYFIRRRGADRLELTQLDDDAEHPLLFVADTEVLERHLIGLFADDIREDLDLPLLEMGWAVHDLARGYEVSEMERGYRTLKRVGGAPVAAAPDPTLSLLALVPLSHYLQWSLADLKRSFLSPTGSPLLLRGGYAAP